MTGTQPALAAFHSNQDSVGQASTAQPRYNPS